MVFLSPVLSISLFKMTKIHSLPSLHQTPIVSTSIAVKVLFQYISKVFLTVSSADGSGKLKFLF